MADGFSVPTRLVNPCRLHLQKLALELKCHICLNLLNSPMLLPCDHILCNGCIPKSGQFGSECQLCKRHYSSQDVRSAPYMENIVTIYRSLDATFTTDLLQPHTPDAGNAPHGSPGSCHVHVVDELKEPAGSPLEENPYEKSTFSLTAKKRVRVSLNSLNEENNWTEKSSNPVPIVTSDQEKCILNDNRQSFRGQSGSAKLCTVKRKAIQVPSPSTSPNDIVGLSSNGSTPDTSNDSFEKHLTKVLVGTNQVGRERKDRPHSGEDCVRDLKRQKKLNNRQLDGCGTNNGIPQLYGSSSERITTKSELKSGECCSVDVPKDLDPLGISKNICAFCQSSKVTDITGMMLHYVNGNEVVGEAAMDSNAIHVHKICIEWTPRTYFVGETVKNLEGEIVRAAQLKCSHCGIKGAALGCYVKSCRRTYHVPCAVEILDCRWDQVKFLMLCPAHSKVKFPGEKSKSTKHAEKKQLSVLQTITSKKSTIEVSPEEPKQLVFCGSALSSEEKFQLVKLASCCGASLTKYWKPNVTHVIASTDSNGAYTRTLKVFKAILHGQWILKTDWLKASMAAKQPVDEEPYELCQDKQGTCNGPKIGRLKAAMGIVPKLFDGLKFHFVGDFVPGYKKELFDLVMVAGGTILKSKQELVSQNHVCQTTPSTTLVVYYSGIMLQEEEHVRKRRIETAKIDANEFGSKVIEHTWILESIASCEVKPFF